MVVRAGEPPVTQEWAARFIPLGQPAQVSVVALAREIPEALKLLTRREVEVLGLIATDLATKEVAARLGVAASTVETHVQHLKQKLRCRGVAGLVRFALAAGLG